MSASRQQEEVPDYEQQAAIDSDERAIAVLAGPGSGKTLVVAKRTRRLLELDPDASALLLTFTNKAAAEMKARALATATVKSDRIYASTFHTFGLQLLRAHGDQINVRQDFTLLDDDQQAEFCDGLYERTGVVEQVKRLGFLRLRRMPQRERAVEAFERVYTEAKREANLVDFDDLVVLAADLYEQYPEIAEAYAARYPYLLVDEFQDTNPAQFAIVLSLAANAKSISVFADDDQAIYKFAGAEARNVRSFIKQLGARTYPLTFNYRCRSAIVTVANRLIAVDGEASGRQMKPYYEGGEVVVFGFATPEAEAIGIGQEIHELVESKAVQPWEVAVLGRSAKRLESVVSALARLEVPTSNWLTDTYAKRDRRILRDSLIVVRDQLSDVQAKHLHQLLGLQDAGLRTSPEILAAATAHPAATHLVELRELAWSGAPVYDVVSKARDAAIAIEPDAALGFDGMLDAIASFQKLDPSFSLDHFDAELALGATGGSPAQSGGVKVASLHKTKGLQWPRVYLLGLENGRLPDFRSVDKDDFREERRICFVGVTRAERRLVLTHVMLDKGHVQQPSQFLGEMGLQT